MGLKGTTLTLKIVGWLEIIAAIITLILGFIIFNISVPAINPPPKTPFEIFVFYGIFLLVMGIIVLVSAGSIEKEKRFT